MICHLKTREGGQGLVEYALILMLIALAVAATVGAFGGALNVYFQAIVGAV